MLSKPNLSDILIFFVRIGAAAKRNQKAKSFSYKSLRPTYTHEAIAKLVSTGLIKYVISQNIDGLHRLSGIPPSQISEVHGNVFHERCEKCRKKYEHRFAYCERLKTKEPKVWEKKCETCQMNHRTGGMCSQPVRVWFDLLRLVTLSAYVFRIVRLCPSATTAQLKENIII